MPSQKMKAGQKKLSDTARYIRRPAGIVSTGWPGVHDRSAQFGIYFDRWQDGLGRLTLAKRENGLYAAGVGGALASIPRQTGKTFLYGWMVFALCTIFPNMTVIWTAHRTRTSDETFEKMRSMAMRPKVTPYIEGKPRAANGQQEIAFRNGSRILFGAREQGFGRGFDEIDILVLDEAQILTESAMSDMVPATNAAANGLVIMIGTPPRPKDPGDVFRSRREDALAGDGDTLYVEFSADQNAKIIDWNQLAKANPSFPHRTSKTAILRMQKLLGSDDNFAREAYGQWDELDAAKAAISASAWKALEAPPPAEDSVLALGVKFTSDGAGVALAAAYRPENGPVYIEPLQQATMGEGLDWLVDYLIEHKDEAAQFILDGKAGVGYLIDALRGAGVRSKRLIITPTLDQVISAHSMFMQAVITGELSHPGISEFDDQVLGAQKRKIGNNGGFGWEPLVDGETVVTLDAATLAFWGAKTTTRRPGRKAVLL